MAYVLTNGKYYIRMTETGAVAKTDNIREARVFLTECKAEERMQKSPGKTKGYYIFEIDEYSTQSITKKRKRYPKEIREMIYYKADCKCALCGREISYDNMTLDHIYPLAMGGEDKVDNLQCACEPCNLFKGSILPDDFMQRITEIFMYQMGKKYKDRWKWKVIQKALWKMI